MAKNHESDTAPEAGPVSVPASAPATSDPHAAIRADGKALGETCFYTLTDGGTVWGSQYDAALRAHGNRASLFTKYDV